jgi:hypothetical protein
MSVYVVIKDGCIIDCTPDHEVAVNTFLSRSAGGMYKIETLSQLVEKFQDETDDSGMGLEDFAKKICEEAKTQTNNLLNQFAKMKDSRSAEKVKEVADDVALTVREVWANCQTKINTLTDELVKKFEGDQDRRSRE